MGAHEAPSRKAFFEGQTYGAFWHLVSLVQRARREIALVDDYVYTGTPNILTKKQPGVSTAADDHASSTYASGAKRSERTPRACSVVRVPRSSATRLP